MKDWKGNKKPKYISHSPIDPKLWEFTGKLKTNWIVTKEGLFKIDRANYGNEGEK